VAPVPEGRSPGRTTALILGGSSPSKKTPSSSVSTPVNTAKKTASAHHKSANHTTTANTTPATNAAETTVTVLNASETAGLAHRVATNLQQSGYSQANALSGQPTDAPQTTLVQYANGHQAEAEGVARSLSVSQVEPIESSVAGLAGSAQVVVIVGANSTVP
jgi:sulfite reductase alpha subunit-like flavoprotein